jgi:hypothetical protein
MNKEAKLQVSIKLPKGWSDHSKENLDGPPTYLRDQSCIPGPLQISFALYKGGVEPNPTVEDLQQFCEQFGAKRVRGELVESHFASCEFGAFGTAVFRSEEYPRFQIWQLSNGKDFIMITHICPTVPDPIEITEAQEIVDTATLIVESKPKWKFWQHLTNRSS